MSMAMRMTAYPAVILGLLGAALGGCAGPNAANIELRKTNQDLTARIESLDRRHQADQAAIAGLRDRIGTLPTLPAARLAKLFTTHGLTLGRLTGGADLDPSKPGDEGIKVYATPTDDDGEALKAAGTFVVEAFDLAAKSPKVGKWSFDLEETRKAWLGAFLAHNFVLTCPWQTIPAHDELTVKVTFRDELTQREFHAQTVIHVKLPPRNPPSQGSK